MPEFTERRKKNSPKVNLTFSVIFHGLLIAGAALWAAHEGVLGKKAKEITAFLVPPDKKKEEKPPPPKVEPPKATPEAPKPTPVTTPTPAAPAPTVASTAPAAVAPAAVGGIDMPFTEGAKQVVTSQAEAQDLNYKGLMESIIRGNWRKPEGLADSKFSADVAVTLDSAGNITGSDFVRGSGNPAWDDSVKKAVAETKSLIRRPPPGFPPKVTVHFDVEEDTVPILQ